MVINLINIIKSEDDRIDYVYDYLKLFFPVSYVYDYNDLKMGVLVLPTLGVDSNGLINGTDLFIDKFIELNKINTIFSGVSNEYLKTICENNDIKLYTLLSYDDILEANSYLTAEGLLGIIISKTPFMIKNSNILLLGYGNCGKKIKEVFDLLGANVKVYSKNYLNSVSLNNLDYDIIINTIPELVLNKDILMKIDSIIFDISSFPYGIDIEYAKRNNINYFIESSIPKRYSPLTSGIILGKKIKEIISE